MADSFGQKGISKKYPVPSTSGIDATDYHKDRIISLEAEQGSLVAKRKKRGL